MKLASAFGAIAATGALLGASMVGGGVSAAAGPDWSGMTYGKAAKDIAAWGYKAVIASSFGDQLAMDDCIVTKSLKSESLDASGRSRGTQILLHLNCSASLAEPGKPGASAASPGGRQAKKELSYIEWFNDDPAKNCAPIASYCKQMCDKYAGRCSASVLDTVASS